MTWFDFLVITLAASAIVDVWFNGSLFSDWRAFFEEAASDTEVPTEQPLWTPPEEPPENPPLLPEPTARVEQQRLPFMMELADNVLPEWVGEIFTCDFCMSYHAPWIVGMVFFAAAYLSPWEWLTFLLRLPVYSLAATRLGNIINAYMPEEARYHRDI